MALQVRLATAADADELARLRYEFRAELRPSVEDEAGFVARCGPWMAARLESQDRWRCWVAMADEHPVGHLWLQLIEKIPNPVGEREQYACVHH